MASPYKHIFFDLDHTLWDYDLNSEQTLRFLYKKHNLDVFEHSHKLSENEFVSQYKIANQHVWHEYSLNRISKSELRIARFHLICQAQQLDYQTFPADLCQEYFALCPQKTNLMPFAIEALDYLSKHHILHILSNGFERTQNIKLDASGLRPYFFSVTTSENSGHKKPSKQIFDYALAQAGARAQDSLMVGDSAQADVSGAVLAGLDAIFYDPTGKHYSFDLPKQVLQISCLSQLIAHLKH